MEKVMSAADLAVREVAQGETMPLQREEQGLQTKDMLAAIMQRHLQQVGQGAAVLLEPEEMPKSQLEEAQVVQVYPIH